MSYNLLKQQYVYNEQSAIRIINSNQKMEDRMKELARIYQMPSARVVGGSVSADFVEGILADEVSPEPEQAPAEAKEELLEEAKTEASRILEEARTNADQILNDANEQAQALYEEQKELGYRAGVAEMEAELNQKMASLDEQNLSLQQELESEYQYKLEHMETDLVETILQVFDKVFHIQFEDKKEILMHLISDTLESVNSGKHFRIMVSEDNWQYVDEHLDALREQLGSDVTLEVARDSKMSDTDCRIESDFGIYDCGMDVELEGLCRDIRSLCSN